MADLGLSESIIEGLDEDITPTSLSSFALNPEGTKYTKSNMENQEAASQPTTSDEPSTSLKLPKESHQSPMKTRSKTGSYISKYSSWSKKHTGSSKSSKPKSSIKQSSSSGTSYSAVSYMSANQVQDYYRLQKESKSSRAHLDLDDLEETFSDEKQTLMNETTQEEMRLREQEIKLQEETRKSQEEARKLQEEKMQALQEEERKLIEAREKLHLQKERQEQMIEERKQRCRKEIHRRFKREQVELDNELKLELLRRGASRESAHLTTAPPISSPPIDYQQPTASTSLTGQPQTSSDSITESINAQPATSMNTVWPGLPISVSTSVYTCRPSITSEPILTRALPNTRSMSGVYVSERPVTGTMRMNENNAMGDRYAAEIPATVLGSDRPIPPISNLANVDSATTASPRFRVSNQLTEIANLRVSNQFNETANLRTAIPRVSNHLDEITDSVPNDRTRVPTRADSTVLQPIRMGELTTPLKLEPKPFEGNPVEFSTFEDMLHAALDHRRLTQKQKLMYLLQYTKGIAHALVSACEDKFNCFDDALSLLKETYGQPFQVSVSCINSVLNGSQIMESDKNAILMFRASLTACVNKLDKFDRIHEVTRPLVEQIADRMPSSWEPGWRSLVAEVTFDQNTELTIKHLNDYVQRKTREITCKCTGTQQNVRKSTFNVANKLPKPKTTFSTQILTPKTVTCILCEESHFLNQCKQFRKMQYLERLKFVNEKRLCPKCLTSGHSINDCNRVKPCIKPDCNGGHTTLLHPPDSQVERNISWGSCQKSTGTQTNSGDAKNDSAASYFSTSPNEIATMVLNVVSVKLKIRGRCDKISTLALIDNASNCSFISQSLINKMNLSGPKLDLTVQTIDQEKSHRKSTIISNLELSDSEESQFVPLASLISTQQIVVDESLRPSQNDIDQYPEFKEIQLPELRGEIGLLIGKNNPIIQKPLKVIHGPEDYFAVKSIAGWMVTCPKRYGASKLHSYFTQGKQNMFCQMCSDEIESTRNEKREYSVNDELFLDQIEKSIKLDNQGHYKMKLPIKQANFKLPSNISQAKQRSKYLQKRFLKDPSFYQEYKAFVSDMISKGYAEQVNDEGIPGRTWHSSHHGVYHPEKKTLRVVFDASAKFNDIALNDLLLQGPDLTNNLVGVLSRFRRNEVAIQGDIRSMFHQVRVHESDRDLLRFLWWKDGDPNQKLLTFRMTVFLFGTISSPSCANFALRKTADENKRAYSDDVVESVFRNFYVDDFLDSKPNDTAAISQIKDITSLLAKGGFEITKWASNNREVIASVAEKDRAKTLKNIDLSQDELPMERTLGLSWNVENDTFCFRVKQKDRPCTRKGLLSIVNSIFDPLGMAQPILQPMKVLMQYLCKTNHGWNDPISKNAETLWHNWLFNLPNLETFSIPRCYKPNDFGKIVKIELHHFSDASEMSYGAVSYLRYVNESGQIHCSFVCGKTRLAPIKGSTIPRMELSAATICARNNKFFHRELKLPIKETYFWTDSTTVLRYLHNKDKAFKTYVANRINIIKENCEISDWKYVPSKQNPADLASRGQSINDFLSGGLWKLGPDFLWNDYQQWPKQPEFIAELAKDDPEIKQTSHCFVSTAKNVSLLESLIAKFSSWDRLKRVLAWVLRFKTQLLSKLERKSSKSAVECIPSNLQLTEISAAETIIIQHEQSKYYPAEIQALSKNQSIKKSSKIRGLRPFLDQGTLRVGGRNRNAPIPFEAKHPIIIPRESSITNLIIRETHAKCGHSGRE